MGNRLGSRSSGEQALWTSAGPGQGAAADDAANHVRRGAGGPGGAAALASHLSQSKVVCSQR